jgi:hypothetical protein
LDKERCPRDRQSRQAWYGQWLARRNLERSAGTAEERAIERPGRTDAEQRQCGSHDDLVGTNPEHAEREEHRHEEPCSRGRAEARTDAAPGGRAHKRAEGAGEDRAFEPDVDETSTFNQELAECRQTERHGGTNRGREKWCDQVVHASTGCTKTSTPAA